MPMAGCMMLGGMNLFTCMVLLSADIPNERMEELDLSVVQVHTDMSDTELVNTVRFWLDSKELRLGNEQPILFVRLTPL